MQYRNEGSISASARLSGEDDELFEAGGRVAYDKDAKTLSLRAVEKQSGSKVTAGVGWTDEKNAAGRRVIGGHAEHPARNRMKHLAPHIASFLIGGLAPPASGWSRVWYPRVDPGFPFWK